MRTTEIGVTAKSAFCYPRSISSGSKVAITEYRWPRSVKRLTNLMEFPSWAVSRTWTEWRNSIYRGRPLDRRNYTRPNNFLSIVVDPRPTRDHRRRELISRLIERFERVIDGAWGKKGWKFVWKQAGEGDDSSCMK